MRIIFYKYPKVGIFEVEPEMAKYGKDGWVQVKKEFKIIGETSDTYVTRVWRERKGSMYNDRWRYSKKRVGLTSTGIHKTRFVRWKQNLLF